MNRPLGTGLLLTLALLAPAAAQTPAGSAPLAGRATLGVRGCGADRSGTARYRIRANGPFVPAS